ncbi:hypothetical protein [Metallosphaera javensis (ex Sakai et al. 2022)]|uniref:hypothetical protein n=1 Tax=Metallosphaera javensis (ex Sakai et al. 2022) TaxID=2775498 RepID=UPI002585F4C8
MDGQRSTGSLKLRDLHIPSIPLHVKEGEEPVEHQGSSVLGPSVPAVLLEKLVPLFKEGQESPTGYEALVILPSPRCISSSNMPKSCFQTF